MQRRSARAFRTTALVALLLGTASPSAFADEPASVDAPEGITLSGSLTGVVQQVSAQGSASGERESRGSYRGDAVVSIPAGETAGAEGKLFAHFRFGQGSGVVLRPTYTSTPNTTAFQAAASAYDAYAVLAEAWYQLTVPLPLGGARPDARERLEVTAGKIDPFAFFDQNAAADDETVRFMNNAFVHNPLLDSGGDVGVDAYGFTPGVRVAYVSERDKPDAWGVSLGVLGSGPGANFTGSPSDAFMIVQVETTRRLVAGLAGTYRLYVWRNGRASDFAGAEESHAGWGISADQRVSDAITAFGRFGDESRGHVRFDRTLTLGAEIAGDAWGRGADAFGCAAGFLRTSDAYRAATADGTLAGYAASGTERIGELYYRMRVGNHLDLTPDAQWISRPGGDASARVVFVGGVRARVGF